MITQNEILKQSRETRKFGLTPVTKYIVTFLFYFPPLLFDLQSSLTDSPVLKRKKNCTQRIYLEINGQAANDS